MPEKAEQVPPTVESVIPAPVRRVFRSPVVATSIYLFPYQMVLRTFLTLQFIGASNIIHYTKGFHQASTLQIMLVYLSFMPQDKHGFERTDMWREGKWLDLWSVVHFLSGVSIGFGFHFIHFGGVATIVIVFLLLTAYEMWEVIVRIEEAPTNRVMDVVVGMLSFLPTFYFLDPVLSTPVLLFTFSSIFTLNVVLSGFGWSASQKATTLEEHMRARYERQRRRLLARRARLQKKFPRKDKQGN